MIELLNSWIGLFVAILSGIALLYGFFKWLNLNIHLAPKQVIVKDGNLYGVLKDGAQRQLTFSDLDSNPILIKKKLKVVFLRGQEIKSRQNYIRYKLMVLDLKKLEENVLADQKPFLDGLDRSSEILSPIGMKLSPDQSKVLFVVEKYVTSGQLVQVDIKTVRLEIEDVIYIIMFMTGKENLYIYLKVKRSIGFLEVRL